MSYAPGCPKVQCANAELDDATEIAASADATVKHHVLFLSIIYDPKGTPF